LKRGREGIKEREHKAGRERRDEDTEGGVRERNGGRNGQSVKEGELGGRDKGGRANGTGAGRGGGGWRRKGWWGKGS